MDLIEKKNKDEKVLLEQLLAVRNSEVKKMEVTEQESTHRITFDIEKNEKDRLVLGSEYGKDHSKSIFDIATGQPYRTGVRRVYYSYMPLSTGRGLIGGLMYIGRRGCPSYILAENLIYTQRDGEVYMYSPAGESEKKFREKADWLLSPGEFLETGNLIPADLKAREMLDREADWINRTIEDGLARVEYIHDWIAEKYGYNKKGIPEAARYLFRSVGIPGLIVQGFCEKAFNPETITAGRKYCPNCEWNMIYLNGSWRFIDIARDVSISHGDKPAYNDFLASPEWFGMSHVSIRAID